MESTNDRIERLSEYTLGDMRAIFYKDGDGHVYLTLIPASFDENGVTYEKKVLHADSVIQAKLLGDAYPGAYAQGISMRNSSTTENMRFDKQETENVGDITYIRTYLKDNHNNSYVNKLSYTKNDFAIASKNIFINNSGRTQTLEYLSSFGINDLSPFLKGESRGALEIHRIRSKWSHEGRLISESAEELFLEDAWSTWQPASVRFGAIGSMPVKDFSPFVGVTDKISGITWAASLMIESSWEMEVYRRDDCLQISGGLADRKFGHWFKHIAPGGRFETPTALLTVCGGDIDLASQRLTHYNSKFLENVPAREKELPILFNEYCTTWGLPSHENIMKITDAIKGRPIDYFVIDCGWFVEEGKSWGDGMGDYIPSDKLFPDGIKYTADKIREKGFKPGIWFEIDNVGRDANVYNNEAMLLKRDGVTLTTGNRRFFDMKNEAVRAYLDERVLSFLKENGFEYMKMDYNDNIGIGCDGAESLGEGLRLDREASVDFVRHIKKEMPNLILENCASGGHKLEPLMMSLCAMASFSDAHECGHIPIIAARLHRTILPRQSQIWAVIRKDDSIKRITYTLANTFLGRMCFSGDVLELTDKQWETIDKGIAFYKEIAPIIKDGYTYFYENYGASEKYLTGYSGIVRVKRKGDALIPDMADEAYAVVHIFNNVPKTDGSVIIPLPENCPKKIVSEYGSCAIESVRIIGNNLVISPIEDMCAVAVRLKA